VIVLIGLAFALWARAELGRNWSAMVVVKVGPALVRTGPCAIVRHPIYTGIITLALGTALDSGTALALGLLCALCAGLSVKSRREEEVMAAMSPEEYPEYRRHVRALVPYVL